MTLAVYCSYFESLVGYRDSLRSRPGTYKGLELQRSGVSKNFVCNARAFANSYLKLDPTPSYTQPPNPRTTLLHAPCPGDRRFQPAVQTRCSGRADRGLGRWACRRRPYIESLPTLRYTKIISNCK